VSRIPTWVPTGLRVGAILLVLLLIVNPRVPGADPAGSGVSGDLTFLVLDADPSLHADGAWDSFLAALAPLDPDGAWISILVTERGIETVDRDALPGRRPGDAQADLEGAISHLVDAGATTIVLASPLRSIEGGLEALERRAEGVAFEVLGFNPQIRNAGLADLLVTSMPRRGEGGEGALVLMGEGGVTSDSVQVVLERSPSGGAAAGQSVPQRVGAWTVPLPTQGVRLRIPFELPRLDTDDPFTLTARLSLTGDAFPWDNTLSVQLDPVRSLGGILLVSLAPDPEPRWILPALEQGTGLSGRGWLRVGGDRFLALREDDRGGAERTAMALRDAFDQAALVVLHGAGSEPLPEGWQQALERHPAVLHLPRASGGVQWAGILAGEPVGGEEPPSPSSGLAPGAALTLPPSPIRAGLSGAVHSELPTLPPPFRMSAGDGIPALSVQLPGAPEARPALLLIPQTEPTVGGRSAGSGEVVGGGRRAVALTTGFWGWAAAGESRAYLALWSSVAGWLLAGRPASDEVSQAPAPARDAAPQRDALLRPTAITPSAQPGLQRIQATEDAPPHRARLADADAGRPLRTLPAPWLLLLVILSVEWILRSRTWIAKGTSG
jgi:hypothetical protein